MQKDQQRDQKKDPQRVQYTNLSTAPMVHVVDDDDAVLDSVGMLLNSIGLRHTCYKNAEIFLDVYSQASFDKHNGCILLDIRMPFMSGIECQHRLENMGCHMPIIFVTVQYCSITCPWWKNIL